MILVLIEHAGGLVKKSSLESLGFARQLAQMEGLTVKSVCYGNDPLSVNLGDYGVAENYRISGTGNLQSDQWKVALAQIAKQISPKYYVLGFSSFGKSLAGQLAVATGAALISGIVGVDSEGGRTIFHKTVFSGKAHASLSTRTQNAVLAVMPNSFSSLPGTQQSCVETSLSISLSESRLRSVEVNLVKGKTPLTEASVVVSAGRGMKDPANWGMIDELADLLGATTACSRPVADAGWRPHHEHVGQTGIAIRPNVYIAIGISGAIQHLAGVNSSRKIIVINKDPEAPFFKAADYGICGDLFEIVPRLNEAIRKHKN